MVVMDVAKLVTEIAAAVGVVYAAARPLALRAWKPIASHFDGVHRMVRGFDTMQGEITSIKTRVDSELGPNGGSSLKDQVTTIAARQAAIFDGMQRPAFQADAEGKFLTVNRAFENLTGYPARDLVGMGWVNLLHQDQVEAFMVAWRHAISDGRILRRECLMVKANDEEISVCVDAVPVKVGTQVLEWQGTLEAA